MAIPTLPDDPGVLAGSAHDLPGSDGDPVVLPVAIPVAPEIDPLVSVSDREVPSLPVSVATPPS